MADLLLTDERKKLDAFLLPMGKNLLAGKGYSLPSDGNFGLLPKGNNPANFLIGKTKLPFQDIIFNDDDEQESKAESVEIENEPEFQATEKIEAFDQDVKDLASAIEIDSSTGAEIDSIHSFIKENQIKLNTLREDLDKLKSTQTDILSIIESTATSTATSSPQKAKQEIETENKDSINEIKTMVKEKEKQIKENEKELEKVLEQGNKVIEKAKKKGTKKTEVMPRSHSRSPRRTVKSGISDESDSKDEEKNDTMDDSETRRPNPSADRLDDVITAIDDNNYNYEITETQKGINNVANFFITIENKDGSISGKHFEGNVFRVTKNFDKWLKHNNQKGITSRTIKSALMKAFPSVVKSRDSIGTAMSKSFLHTVRQKYDSKSLELEKEELLINDEPIKLKNDQTLKIRVFSKDAFA